MNRLLAWVLGWVNYDRCEAPFSTGEAPVIDWRCTRRAAHDGRHVRRAVPLLHPRREW